MEKKEMSSKNKILLLIYLSIAWFLPYIYSFIKTHQTDKWKQAIVIILSFVVSTVLYNTLKNRTVKLIVLLAAVVCVTVFLGYRYTLSAFTAFAVIYAYESLASKDHINVRISEVLLALSVLTAIAGLFINFSAIMDMDEGKPVIVVVFAIIFLILAKYAHINQPNTKAKKSRKAKESETDFDTLYKTVFSISAFGVLSSAASFIVTNSLTFFPWFFFIVLLICKVDNALYSASEMIVNRIKAFVE